jgi:hypothetical protein
MKTRIPMLIAGATALFATGLCLQAQSTPSSQSSQSQDQRQQSQSTIGGSPGSSNQAGDRFQNQPADTNNSDAQRKSEEERRRANERGSNSSYSSGQQNGAQSNQSNNNQNQDARNRNQSQTNSNYRNSQSMDVQGGVQTNTAVSGEVDTQVRTVVQDIDAQGPVVVERITTRFADITCTPENARLLVESLHNGSSVTLRGDDGTTVTFQPQVHLGYGDAYIALALAAETLRQNGIQGCATPAQWQAVLMGGQLSGGASTPGILVLHSQSGGWAQVAQTTHVELNQIVSEAHSSLQLNSSSQQNHDQSQSTDSSKYNRDQRSGQNPGQHSGQTNGQDKDKNRPYDSNKNPKPDTPPSNR